MEKQKQQYLHESTVKKEVIQKITEEREENGQKIQVTKDSKSIKPIKIAVLKPDRKKYKEADIFYAKTLSNYLKEGLLPHSLVSKRYTNDGGPLTDQEKKTINALREKYVELQEEYFGMEGTLTEDQNKRRGQILSEMTEINQTVKEIKDSYSDIFNQTAEAKTRNDSIEWWVLNLSLIDEDGNGYKHLYGDGDVDSRMNNLEKMESKNDSFFNEVIKKLSYFISFWYSSSNSITDKDFKSAEDYYESSVSLYMKDEEEEEIEKEENKNSQATEIKQPENIEQKPNIEPEKKVEEASTT